ncbi:MAG: hypothetical protein ACTJGH_00485 [Peptoniphilaceae bacterium]
MENQIILTAVVLGIVQAFKTAGLPSKYSPIVAIVIGATLMAILEGNNPKNILTGIVIGLSAVGLYTSGTQFGDTINKIKPGE